MGRPIQKNGIPLQPKMVLEPFKKWAIYFLGPKYPSSHRHSYILIYTNYVTKWMQAKGLPKKTKQEVMDFLHEDIFVRFEIP
jgi:hypothetical protein